MKNANYIREENRVSAVLYSNNNNKKEKYCKRLAHLYG